MSWRRGQAYSQDLRDRVLSAVAAGMTVRRAAARFGVSPAYVAKAAARWRRSGERGARGQHSHQPRKLAPYHAAIAAQVAAHPDATLDELRRWLLAEHSVASSSGGMWNTLSRLGLTLKKSRSTRASRSVPMSLPRGRIGWHSSPS